jgi:hypothetical protein
MSVDDLTTKSASEVLRDSDRDSVGVVRVLAASAGKPGEEREYVPGDEALVEQGVAEWVVAPVHLPSAGRRLDHDAEREATPLAGVEAYPPAEPTTAARRGEARHVGHVKAHSAEGLSEKLAAKRVEVARGLADESDAALQAELGGLGARSGPVTAHSDLGADKALRDLAVGRADGADGADGDKAGKSATAPKGK